jgi:hypothetical protein
MTRSLSFSDRLRLIAVRSRAKYIAAANSCDILLAPMSAKRLKTPRVERTETGVFAKIALFAACPGVLVALLICFSIRPSLYDLRPETANGGTIPVDWRTLDNLVSVSGGPEAARPDLFGPELQVAGYMWGLGGADVQDGLVKRFLLVPDPGNWIHPPHFHSGEVIDVMLKNGVTTPLLERQAVVVRGILSVDPMELNLGGTAIYHLKAVSVEIFAR